MVKKGTVPLPHSRFTSVSPSLHSHTHTLEPGNFPKPMLSKPHVGPDVQLSPGQPLYPVGSLFSFLDL